MEAKHSAGKQKIKASAANTGPDKRLDSFNPMLDTYHHVVSGLWCLASS